MPATAIPHYVGLDIAKDQLDYCISETDEGSFPNTAPARAKFIEQLQRLRPARIVCEASGGYEKIVVAELLAAGIEVCVVQPGRVRAFAYAEGLLAKTDRIDARLASPAPAASATPTAATTDNSALLAGVGVGTVGILVGLLALTIAIRGRRKAG